MSEIWVFIFSGAAFIVSLFGIAISIFKNNESIRQTYLGLRSNLFITPDKQLSIYLDFNLRA